MKPDVPNCLWTAYCLVCCGGGKKLKTGKRIEAEREATSHLNLYGHDVTIIKPSKEKLVPIGTGL